MSEVSVIINVRENTALGDLNTDNCRADDPDWKVFFNQDQILEVEISTQDLQPDSPTGEIGEEGDEVGLVQTLVKSERIGTYKGGGELHIIPDATLPCLDARPEDAPFFDEQAGPKQLPAPGEEPITLRLTDGPSVDMVSSAVDAQKQSQPIESLKVEEEFLVTLWNKTQEKIIAQWSWQYSYEIGAGNLKAAQSQSAQAEQKGEGEFSNEIITDATGAIAGTGQTKGWTQGYNSQDPIWAGDQLQGSNEAEDDAGEEDEGGEAAD